VRKWIAIAAGLAMLVTANYLIYGKERVLTEGRIVLLRLAPVDPRSLMQGDYMALRFWVTNAVLKRGRLEGRLHDGRLRDGRIVLRLDERDVGRFVRFDDGAPLGPDEVRLRYRVRDGEVKLATNAFFFREGDAELYEAARYGEFRVGANGEAILTGLRGSDLQPLGPK